MPRPRRFGFVGLLAVVGLAVVPVLASGAASADAHPPTVIPTDSVVLVVSADNPVSEMSRLHLEDLYLGRTDRFPDGQPAEPIDQAPGSPARAVFYEGYLGRSLAEIKAHWSRLLFTGRGEPPREVRNGVAVRDLVGSDPHAIGYLNRALVDGSVHVVRIR